MARSIYKNHYVRPTNSKKRIEGPPSHLLPPDSKLEKWMVDPDWVPEGGPVTITFTKDSVPGNQMGVIMKEAVRAWNKDCQTSEIGYGSSSWNDKGEGGSG